jgi:hypothetical protein
MERHLVEREPRRRLKEAEQQLLGEAGSAQKVGERFWLAGIACTSISAACRSRGGRLRFHLWHRGWLGGHKLGDDFELGRREQAQEAATAAVADREHPGVFSETLPDDPGRLLGRIDGELETGAGCGV